MTAHMEDRQHLRLKSTPRFRLFTHSPTCQSTEIPPEPSSSFSEPNCGKPAQDCTPGKAQRGKQLFHPASENIPPRRVPGKLRHLAIDHLEVMSAIRKCDLDSNSRDAAFEEMRAGLSGLGPALRLQGAATVRAPVMFRQGRFYFRKS